MTSRAYLPLIAALLALFLMWRDVRADLKPIMVTQGKSSCWLIKDYQEIVWWRNCFTNERR